MKFNIEYQATVHGTASVESERSDETHAANLILKMLESEGYHVTNFQWLAEPDKPEEQQ